MNMKHGGDIYSETIEYDFSINLNPLDCSEIIDEIIEDSRTKLGNYPDLFQRTFREVVARVEGVGVDQVYGGNGAAEILMAIITMLNPNKAMLLRPCFSGYEHALARILDCTISEYTLSEESGFEVNEDFLFQLEKEVDAGLNLLIIANPNNPTGKCIRSDILDRALEICRDNHVSMIVDECFLRMSKEGKSLVRNINDYEGLYVVNAFTKLFAIPGVRVGYTVTSSKNIDQLIKVLPEWNLSTIAQSAGVICSRYLCESSFTQKTKEYIAVEREYLSHELRNMGFKVYESDTAFILFYADEDIYEYLRSKKILIRDCSDYQGLSKGYYRIAVKNHRENELLIQALKMRVNNWN